VPDADVHSRHLQRAVLRALRRTTEVCLMPKGVYTRQHARPKVELVPMAPPPMPSRKGRWRASTQRAWASWAESGRMSALDQTGLASLGRLMHLLDKAEANDWPLGLTREIRLLEAALMRNIMTAPVAPAPEVVAEARKENIRASRERHKAKREAALADLDHSVWPGCTTDEPAHPTAGRYGRAPLDDRSLTDAQRREVARFNQKQETA
jgi:hypothetical protein